MTLLHDRYRIIRPLSTGGFGETFLAEDIQMPSLRRCVIKQLKPIINQPQLYQLIQERFQREAVILENLGEQSNQIPKLYAYFTTSTGQFYLVQEWIEGQTLKQKLETSGQLSESCVREILVSLLPVLDYIHSQRIIHRDIKPDNIILRQRDNKPVLIDFGAVKETMATICTQSGNSASSIVIGTPGFMPSEQAAGRPVYSSDLYSLGLTAIYLLTGKIPQELGTDFSTGEIIWHPYALSVSPSLAAVLDKAIQPYSRDRYSTAREMLQALHSFGSTITSSAPSTLVTQSTQVLIPSTKNYVQPPSVASTQSVLPQANGLGDLQKVLIMGGMIGSCVVGGLWLTRQPSTQISNQPSISESNSSAPSVSSPQPVSASATPQPQTTQPLTHSNQPSISPSSAPSVSSPQPAIISITDKSPAPSVSSPQQVSASVEVTSSHQSNVAPQQHYKVSKGSSSSSYLDVIQPPRKTSYKALKPDATSNKNSQPSFQPTIPQQHTAPPEKLPPLWGNEPSPSKSKPPTSDAQPLW